MSGFCNAALPITHTRYWYHIASICIPVAWNAVWFDSGWCCLFTSVAISWVMLCIWSLDREHPSVSGPGVFFIKLFVMLYWNGPQQMPFKSISSSDRCSTSRWLIDELLFSTRGLGRAQSVTVNTISLSQKGLLEGRGLIFVWGFWYNTVGAFWQLLCSAAIFTPSGPAAFTLHP